MTAPSRRRRWGTWVLLAVSAAALALSVWSGIERQHQAAALEDYARCQARVNDAIVSSTLARADAADQDRASDRAESTATANLIQGVFTASSREQLQHVYALYEHSMGEITERRAAAEAQRRANPLPAPPSETCG